MPLKDSMAPIFIAFQGYIYVSIVSNALLMTKDMRQWFESFSKNTWSYMEKRVYSKGYLPTRTNCLLHFKKNGLPYKKTCWVGCTGQFPSEWTLFCSKRGFPTHYWFAVSSACMLTCALNAAAHALQLYLNVSACFLLVFAAFLLLQWKLWYKNSVNWKK